MEIDVPGVGIRRNGDDDNANQVADRLETNVQGENDLIEIELFTQPNPSPGIEYWLRRTNHNINVWSEANKATGWYTTGDAVRIPASTTGWVEWNTMDPNQTGANLELYLWDVTHQRAVPGSTDTLHFYPFTSVVIALGGEDQVPVDPPPPNLGVFVLAGEMYRDGYDVHMYDEDAIDTVGAGVPFNEVLQALTQRGVTQVAVYGYSHGGGSTFLMVRRLFTMNGVSVNFTAYIDGVEDEGGPLDNDPEVRRPPGSAFHANYYQHGVSDPLDPLFDWGLDGGPIVGLLPTDWEIDVETQPPGAPWDPVATHYTIDNPSPPSPAPVHADLMTRFRARINR